jgi:hypothetical protein
MQDILKKYANSNGHWLLTFEYAKIPIKPLPFKMEGVITAMYIIFPEAVYVSGDKNNDVVFGSLVHELYHAYQRHTMGFCKYFFCKTFNRKKLEEPAKQAELDAVQWYGEMEVIKMKENMARRKNA